MDLGAELLLNFLVYLALAVPAAVGIVLLRPFCGRWLPLPRLRRGNWSGREVLLCAFLYLYVVPAVVVHFLDRTGFFFWLFGAHVTAERQLNAAQPIIALFLPALCFPLLYWISGTRAAHLGLSMVRWRENVRLGLAAFALATPVILIVYTLVLLVTPHVPHPLELIAQEDLRSWEWLLVGANAVAAAPLLEEWLCRGIIQGWLRRASPLGHLVVGVFALTFGSLPTLQSYVKLHEVRQERAAWIDAAEIDPHDEEAIAALDLPEEEPVLWAALIFAAVCVGLYLLCAARLWQPVFEQGMRYFTQEPTGPRTAEDVLPAALEGNAPVIVPRGPRWEAFKRGNARLAVVGSALLFALAHGAWPAPVPLVLFGLLVGWLQLRTQNLLAGIVFHALFNAVAFIVLLTSTLAGHENGKAQATAARPAGAGPVVRLVPGS
ncbi:MAG: CPBP family intramembrane metalloprotease [Gemmataceae bacterium]|nr:CPBP family intramembrane metalloprotease [Gemmataceae bacterium]